MREYTQSGHVISALISQARKNGGATIGVNAYRDILPVSSGYVVGGRGPSLVIHSGQDDDNSTISIAVFWLDRQLSKKLGTRYFGSWQDDKGNVWLDAVDLVTDEDAALALGKERGEIAIFDLDTFTEIPVN